MPEQSLTATAHIAALLCDAERHERHSHAEHGNDSQPPN
ncbi:rplA family protein [Pseudomonas syringae]|nr:rplA family protein [Pseudomonas syringae]